MSLQAHADSFKWQECAAGILGSAVVTLGLLLGQAAPGEARARLGAEEQKQVDMFLKNTASVVNVTSLSSRRDAFTSDMQDYPQGAGSGIVWDSQGHVVVRARSSACSASGQGRAWKAAPGHAAERLNILMCCRQASLITLSRCAQAVTFAVHMRGTLSSLLSALQS